MRTYPRNVDGLREAYSLLEVILAVAILASSGLLLQATMGQGTRLGLKAEQRTRATELAQSLLDKHLAFAELGERQEQGFFDSAPEWAYRVSVESVDTIPKEVALRRIIVDVLPARAMGARASTAGSRPTCRLVRWVRASLDQSAEAVSDDATKGSFPDRDARTSGGTGANAP
jgi:type II secretory pathway pseudopilin PulG